MEEEFEEFEEHPQDVMEQYQKKKKLWCHPNPLDNSGFLSLRPKQHDG
ncbi:hypothetical protein HJZ93_23475, partial [Vibrio parahaemolyticus]|nr:hypothetical protein [Vibrio parahaemolyticus]